MEVVFSNIEVLRIHLYLENILAYCYPFNLFLNFSLLGLKKS